jgi:integrase
MILGGKMNSKLTVSFKLITNKPKQDKSVPIYMRITYSSKSIQISTGISIHRKHWNLNTFKIMGNSREVKTKNETLKILELKVWNVYNNLVLQQKPFTVHSIKDLLNTNGNTNHTILQILDLYISRIEKLLKTEYTPSTLQKYSNTRMRIEQFIKSKYIRNDLKMFEIDNSFVMDFLDYLKVNMNNQPKTIQKHNQRLVTMFNYSVKRGVIEKIPFSSVKVSVPPKIVSYLTQEEIDKIQFKDFHNERLNIIRDMFIFSIYSGFSYTELKNLHEEHIRMIDGQIWVEMIRQKTQRPYKVPLLPKCVELIERYKNHEKRLKNGLLLPLPTNQKFNSYLKEIQDLCSISTKLTCHLGRRTFGSTILLKNNVNIHVISQLLGHSNTSITIKSYLGTVPEMMLDEFDKIKSIYK